MIYFHSRFHGPYTELSARQLNLYQTIIFNRLAPFKTTLTMKLTCDIEIWICSVNPGFSVISEHTAPEKEMEINKGDRGSPETATSRTYEIIVYSILMYFSRHSVIKSSGKETCFKEKS
jgi:hypothetical protein